MNEPSPESGQAPAVSTPVPEPSPLARFARNVLPFIVSGLLLAYLFQRIDFRTALEYFTLDVALRFALPLVIFNFATLAIESQCLHRVAIANALPLTRSTAARIKAACYSLGILNYAIGAAGLSVLLRRRTGAGLATAAGMVFLVALFDMGAVLVWVGVGATLMQTDAVALRIGVIGGLLVAIASGFVFLRFPYSLGPLEAIRNLRFLDPPRTAPLSLLFEIGFWRLAFCGCFVLLVRALFWAYGLDVGAVELAFKVAIMLIVSAIPIAAGGLGTGQIVFVELFKGHAPEAQLLSASITFSIGIILVRAATGVIFAREFAREALAATRSEEMSDATTEPSISHARGSATAPAPHSES